MADAAIPAHPKDSGVLITLSFLLGVLALLADMLGRHRLISEELLYLARRKIYAGKLK